MPTIWISFRRTSKINRPNQITLHQRNTRNTLGHAISQSRISSQTTTSNNSWEIFGMLAPPPPLFKTQPKSGWQECTLQSNLIIMTKMSNNRICWCSKSYWRKDWFIKNETSISSKSCSNKKKSMHVKNHNWWKKMANENEKEDRTWLKKRLRQNETTLLNSLTLKAQMKNQTLM